MDTKIVLTKENGIFHAQIVSGCVDEVRLTITAETKEDFMDLIEVAKKMVYFI